MCAFKMKTKKQLYYAALAKGNMPAQKEGNHLASVCALDSPQMDECERGNFRKWCEGHVIMKCGILNTLDETREYC